jgi:hypothetical protein
MMTTMRLIDESGKKGGGGGQVSEPNFVLIFELFLQFRPPATPQS